MNDSAVNKDGHSNFAIKFHVIARTFQGVFQETFLENLISFPYLLSVS